jgi:His-Xaa-Ser system radical SAM maturase HxsC
LIVLHLKSHARIRGELRGAVLKIITIDDFLASRLSPEQCVLLLDDEPSVASSRIASDVAWGAVMCPSTADHLDCSAPRIDQVRYPDAFKPGAVVNVDSRSQSVHAIYRRESPNNSLFVTERCNSYCIMCSQPPVDRDDPGRIDWLIRAVELIDRDVPALGITGGEPTLLGDRLLALIRACREHLPNTSLHILTNGRRFSEFDFVTQAAACSPAVTWAIPLYSDAPEIHDYVVQSQGAFAQTLSGLMNLARLDQSVEIRIVLQRAVAPRMAQLAHFIARNLPFVAHVAWMGLEPMGFARGNWNAIWLEPEEFVPALGEGVAELRSRGIATSVYNLPLCVLPPELWPHAAQSISDWKNEYQPECVDCTVKSRCCGFFSSARREHLPRAIRPIRLSTEAVRA